jgi:hypothetical protein
MDSNTTNDLLQRKFLGTIEINSKKDNYIITAVFISSYAINKKDDEITKKFANNMLKYFSYEIKFNRNIILYFDFIKCKEETGIEVNKYLPIPYLIRVHILDKDEKAEKKKFALSLIAYDFDIYENKSFYIFLKKADLPNNDDFVIINECSFIFYIVHKYEEDWKRFMLYKEKSWRY